MESIQRDIFFFPLVLRVVRMVRKLEESLVIERFCKSLYEVDDKVRKYNGSFRYIQYKHLVLCVLLLGIAAFC